MCQVWKNVFSGVAGVGWEENSAVVEKSDGEREDKTDEKMLTDVLVRLWLEYVQGFCTGME